MKRLLTTAVFTALLHFAAFSQCSNLKLSVDKKFQCAPGIVNFKLSGAPAGSSYSWDFGNGFIANTDTVYEFFLNPQIIDVTVQVTFPNGTNCTVQENGIAEILGKPALNFEISRTKLCDGPDTVRLINTTPNTKEISWIVDGTNYFSAPDTLIHQFKTPGNKDINMVVTDSFGCRNVKEFTHVAEVLPDVNVNFVADHTDGCVTKNVQFTALLNKNGQKVVKYDWAFEGAHLKSAKGLTPPVLRYSQSGKYGAALTVTTDKGCVHDLKKEDYLEFGDSIQLEIDIKDQILCMKDSTVLKVKNPIEGGRYFWNVSGDPDTTMRSQTEITTKFDKPGEFNVSLVLNYGGCFSMINLKDAIKVKELKAQFKSSDNYHCYTPHITHIKNTSTSYNNVPLTYQWSVSDLDSTLLSRTYKKDLNYASPSWGRYTVELIVKDPFGCTDTMHARQYIRVDSIRPAISAEERIGCVNQKITLRTSTPASSYISSDSFYWKIYDLDGKKIHNSGRGRDITQSFSKPGYYNVTLYAGNTIGCKDTLGAKKFIHIIEPKKDFKVNTPLICAHEEAEIEATTTPRTAPFQYTWEVIHQKTSITSELETDTARKRNVRLDHIGKYDIRYKHQINKGCIDSFEKKAAIHVNGLVGEIKLTKASGCVPMETQSSFVVRENVHIGDTSNKLNYTWHASPGDGVTISSNTSAKPTFTFTKSGTYTIYMTAWNSVNCKYSSKSVDILVGVVADFELDRNNVCANETVSITNKSLLQPAKLEWSVISSGDYSLNQTTDPIQFVPKSDTFYDIRLIASKDDACFDTMTKRVHSLIVTSDFEMADTHLYCAPAYAQFNTLSHKADTFFWDFGDGSTIKSTDPYIANIYQRNTGAEKGFDVTLISKSFLGCADTLTIESAVKIFGPVPEFSIGNNVGCEPLTVNFTNKSKSVAQYFLNFDDNTNLDSTNFDTHTYRVQTTNLSQRFIPSVYALDSLGCAAIYESPDTILVLKRPKAIPSDQEIEGCSPVQVALNDESQRITSRSWLLNGSEISRETSITPSISEPGNHVIELVVTNQNNCSDTSTFGITVHENPKAHYTLTQIPCLNEAIEALGHSNQVIEKWVWTIENLAIVDTTSTPVYPFTFSESGNYRLQMKAITQNGCTDEFDSTFLIRGVDDIPEGEIEYVTVNDLDEIEVHWKAISPDFISYTTVKDNETQQVLYQDVVNAESMVKVLYSNLKQQHCFILSHTNYCGENGVESHSHCPVILNVQKAGNFELKLDWSSYTGWSDVDEYVIYRSDDGVSFEELVKVDGSTHTYTDELLCDQEYCYVVEARLGELKSRSNKDRNRPDYFQTTLPLDVTYATVENNEYVEVNWDEPKTNYPVTYRLNQYDAYGTSLLYSFDLNTTSFIDEELDVNSENFIYKVQILDHCGIAGTEGYQGKPILLEGFYQDDASHLSWSAYEEWDEGVDFYEIQIEINGMFETIATVPGSQTAYVDKEFHDEINEDYVYRVVAVSFNAHVTSTSNHVSLQGASFVWVPNAFSPNEDDHNPNFKPSAQFVYLVNDGTYRDYEMKIFNRWGEELFVTNDINHGWDGTYKNKPCESEMYLYHIRVTGLDRVVYDKKGLVRLMR
ncbi:MAG: gliding motility-associated C-terminal domain-containing protein [Bacteroidia bacterium]|nr:gliding motility-associated C-terminal domain-containing protein [Bacteroidia bacterium]